MNILLRDVSPALAAALDAEARRRNASRNDLILALLGGWAEPPIVLGWFKATRNGECDLSTSADPSVCAECGQPLDWPWLAILSNGAIHGPVCSACATSE